MRDGRSYGERCAAAHALDLVGERWALLVVRELLLGPKRFTDLRSGVPNASPNVLAQRLRELERDGVVGRRRLGPPARAWVYELTEWGRDLERVIVALARWGGRSPWLPKEGEVGADAAVLALCTMYDPELTDGLVATFELRFGDDRYWIRAGPDGVNAGHGELPEADATVDSDPTTFTALLTRVVRPAVARREGRLRVRGDATAFERLLQGFAMPDPVPAPAT